jgi:hypothetical protein
MVMVVSVFITVILVTSAMLSMLVGVMSVARMFWMHSHCRFSMIRGFADNVFFHKG